MIAERAHARPKPPLPCAAAATQRPPPVPQCASIIRHGRRALWLSGYDFSLRRHQRPFNVEAIADGVAQLMTEGLSSRSFGTEEGD